MKNQPEEKKCCVMCRESLADNFCMAPTCKCHASPEVPEWENVVDSWIFDFTSDGTAGMFYGDKSVIIPFPNEFIKSFIAHVRNQTLEEVAEAAEKALIERARICDYADRTEYDESAEIAVATIRSLKK